MQDCINSGRYHSVDSLWFSVMIWWPRSGSTLVQVMACCLMAPSHYLKQCWLTSKADMIQQAHDMILVMIWSTWYNTFHDTFDLPYHDIRCSLHIGAIPVCNFTDSNFTVCAQVTFLYNEFNSYTFKIPATFPRHHWVNSLWPSDIIWWQGFRSAMAQVMACCLRAPSHYLNQCWLMISEVLWHSPDSDFTENT